MFHAYYLINVSRLCLGQLNNQDAWSFSFWRSSSSFFSAFLSWYDAISIIGISSGATIMPRAMSFSFGMISLPRLLSHDQKQHLAHGQIIHVFCVVALPHFATWHAVAFGCGMP